MSLSGIMAGAAYIKLTMNDAQAMQALDRTKSNLKSFAAAARTAGDTLMLISAPLASVVDRFAKFSDTMLQVKAISQASGSELAHLEKLASELGRTTAFTSTQVAQGMAEFARMGFTSKEITQSIRPALDLVRATGEEMWRLGEFTEFATSVLRIFNLQTSEFSRVADVLTQAANKSSVGIADLGMSLKIVGPSAKAMGESLESTTALLMTLADTGIRGSEAGTMLRRVFQALAEQSAEGQEAANHLRNLGIELKTASGKARSARAVFVDIAKKMREMTDIEKINFSVDVFDLRGSAAALNLAEFSSKLESAEKSLENARGAAKRAAGEMESGLGGSIRLINSAFQELGNTLSKSFSGPLGDLLNLLTSVMQGMREFIASNSAGVVTLSKMALTVGVVGGSFKILFSTLHGIKQLYAPIRELDGMLRRFRETQAAKAATPSASQLKLATAQENVKIAAAQRADAVKQEMEARAALREKTNAVNSAGIVVWSEQQKLAAIKARYAAEEQAARALNAQQQVDKASKKRSDLIQKASSDRSELQKIVQAKAAAQASLAIEQQKLAIARQRYAEEQANAQKAGLQQSLDVKHSVLGTQKYKEVELAKKEMEAQALATNRAIASVTSLAHKEDALRQKIHERTLAIRAANQAYSEAKTTAENGTAAPSATSGLSSAGKDLKAQEKVVAKAIADRDKLIKQENVLVDSVNKRTAATLAATNTLHMESLQVQGLALADGKRVKSLARLIVLEKGKMISDRQKLRMMALMKVMSKDQIALAYQEAGSSAVAAGANALWGKANIALGGTFQKLWAVIAANPIGFIITAITAAITAITYLIEKNKEAQQEASRFAKAQAERSGKEREKEKEKRDEGVVGFERLKQLEEISKRTSLTAEEMKEAEELINQLAPFGAENWANLDKATGKLKLLKDAYVEFAKEAKKRELQKIDDQIKNTQRQIDKYYKKEDVLEKRSYVDENGMESFYYVKTGTRKVKRDNLSDEEIADMEEANKKLAELKKERNKLEQRDAEELLKKRIDTQAKVDEYNRKKAEMAKAAVDAEKKVAEMEADAAEQNKSKYDKEIEAIRKKKAEYEKLIATLIKAQEEEKNENLRLGKMDAVEKNDENIKALQERLRKQNEFFELQERKVESKQRDQISDREMRLDDRIEQDKERDEENSIQKKYDTLRNEGGDAAGYMRRLMTHAKSDYLEQLQVYRNAMDHYTSEYSDKGSEISDDEKKVLDRMEAALFKFRDKFFAYRDKFREAKAATEARVTATGDWSFRNMMSNIGATAQERTAAATEAALPILKKIQDSTGKFAGAKSYMNYT